MSSKAAVLTPVPDVVVLEEGGGTDDTASGWTESVGNPICLKSAHPPSWVGGGAAREGPIGGIEGVGAGGMEANSPKSSTPPFPLLAHPPNAVAAEGGGALPWEVCEPGTEAVGGA